MQVAVCMSSKPAFVMQGKPNGSYLITTVPTYFAAVTAAKDGTVISASYVSSPTEFDFQGTTNVVGILDDTLTFTFTNAKE